MNDTTEQTPKKGIRWSRVVLALSLGLNIAVVGVVAGAWLSHDEVSERVRSLQARDGTLGPYLGAMDPQGRRELGRDYLREAGGPMVARREAQVAFEAVLGALRAEPFDAKAFEVALMAQQGAMADRQIIGAKLLAARVAGLEAAERRAYADRLDRILTRPPRDDGDHGREGREGRDGREREDGRDRPRD